MTEWIKINIEKDKPPSPPFLLSDEYENIYVGHTSFDYYDAVYWFPIPKYPLEKGIITNDEWIAKIGNQDLEDE